MDISKQVVSLELAKRLKQLGEKQDSLWYWVEHYESGTDKIIWSLYQNDEDDIVNKHISAFTVAELGEKLLKAKGQAIVYTTYFNNYKNEFVVEWVGDYDPMNDYTPNKEFKIQTNEADARGKLLIYLIEKEEVMTKTQGRCNVNDYQVLRRKSNK